MIDHIFQEILPNYGMAERPAQIKLSHEMLEAMLGGKIALCDAGTGIGKTYAYLVAGAVADRCRGTKPFQPILISTSSIALQSAVQEQYRKSICQSSPMLCCLPDLSMPRCKPLSEKEKVTMSAINSWKNAYIRSAEQRKMRKHWRHWKHCGSPWIWTEWRI